MTKNKLTAAILAALMSVSLCACGADDPAADTGSSKEYVTADTAAAEEQAESAADEAAPETEPSSADGAGTGDAGESVSEMSVSASPADSSEAAEVQKVVDTYFKALREKDYDTLLDVTDVELIYYLTNGELGTREDYITCLKEQVVTGDSSAGDLEITVPELQDGYIKQYTDFFEQMDELSEGETAFADTFKIDRVYAVRMKASGNTDMSAASDESGSINFDISVNGNYNIDIDMPIIHVNGEWKCDPAVSMAMSLINMFSNMADSLSAAE